MPQVTTKKGTYTVDYTMTSTGSCSSSLCINMRVTPLPKTKEEMDDVFEQLYKSTFSAYQVGLLFVSPVDYSAKGRDTGYQTSNFVHWLIENNKGFVCSSPIFVNPSHGLGEKSSLCQTFTWTPEAAFDAGYVVEETGGTFGNNSNLKKSYNRGTYTAKVPWDKLVNPHLVGVKHFAKARAKWDEDKAGVIAKLKEPVKWKAKRKSI